MSNTALLCKDCKHSFVPWNSRVLSGFFFVDSIFYQCRLTKQEKHIQFNIVTGPKRIETKYDSCSLARSRYSNICGEEGKSWTPKNKKHLFLAITRGET